MTPPQLRIRPEAESDITDAGLWYEDRETGLGARFLDEVDRLFDQIALAPTRFPRVDSSHRRALLRRFPFGVYFTEQPLVVIAVLHLHRHPDTWRGRR